jgi:aryl-alcohol dehydrogenase-like predicted oxidoreductase
MQYRKLGRTGFDVSALGYGAWGLGGDAYGPVSEIDAQASLSKAFDAGVNFYDTSNLYGQGKSEEILGDFFRSRRDKVFIATKFGILPHSGRALPQDYSLDNIRKCLDGSLKRLKSDYIDLYLFHSPTLDVFENPEVFELLSEFKKQGKIRALGGSMRSPADALTAIQKHSALDAVQVNFNMIDQRAVESGLTKIALDKNVGVIARTPLCFGFLTATFEEKDLQFGEKDHRRFYPIEQLRIWAQAPKLFASFYRDRTPTEVAVRFCMDSPGVSTVIPGMIRPEEVDANIKIEKSKPLSTSELAEIFSIYSKNQFFDPKLSYRPPKWVKKQQAATRSLG